MANHWSCSLKTAIVGYGIIGRATHVGLLNNNPDVAICDINIPAYSTTKVESCDIIFVCIPTGSNNEVLDMCNLCADLSKNNPTAEIVIRSTIPPGYIDQVKTSCNNQLVYCPEFLRERKWQSDCLLRPVVVASNKTELKLFDIIAESECQRISLIDAAIVKLMSNVFNSLRITFANHVYEYCLANNADFNQVIPFLQNLQKNKEQSYLEVTDALRGFGGKCLPKDLDFCIADFSEQNITQTLFTAVKNDNANWPTTVRRDL